MKVNAQLDYKAVVRVRGSRMAAALSGDATAVAALRTALGASLFVQESASPRFTVQAGADGYHVAVPDATRPVPGAFPLTPAGVTATVAALEHMAQWTMRVELTNPASQIPVGDVDVAISYYNSANMEPEDRAADYGRKRICEPGCVQPRRQAGAAGNAERESGVVGSCRGQDCGVTAAAGGSCRGEPAGRRGLQRRRRGDLRGRMERVVSGMGLGATRGGRPERSPG